MLRREATVTAGAGGRLALALGPPVACAGCGGRCGLLAWSRARRGEAAALELPMPSGAAWTEGDHVVLELDPRRVLRAAVLAYGLPLSGLLAGAWSLRLWPAGGGDAAVLAAAGLGLGLGLVLARTLARRLDLQPVVRRCPGPGR